MSAVRSRVGTTVVAVLVAGGAVLMLTADGEEARVADAGEIPGIAWSEPITVDTGPGVIGPWRMNESVWRYVDDPAVALDANGRIGVVWVDHARKTVLFQRYGVEQGAGDGTDSSQAPSPAPVFDAPTEVSRSPGVFSWLPRVAFAPDDPAPVYVFWQEIVFSGGSHGGEAFFAPSTDGGRTFEPPVNLSRSPEGDGKGRLTERRWQNGSLDLAVGPDGVVHLAWTEYEGRLWYRRSTDRGASFEEAVPVGGGAGEPPARGPSLAVGPGDAVHLAWAVGEDPDADLRLARSADGGASFGDPRVVLSSSGRADAPVLSVDAGGTLHLAWSVQLPGFRGRSEVRYVRSSDGGESFEAARRIGQGLAGDVDGSGFPSLALGGSDAVYLVWELYPQSGEPPRGLGLAVSRDGGDTFSETAVVPGTAEPGHGVNGSLQGRFGRKLAAGTRSRFAVVNSRVAPGEGSRVRLVAGSDTMP